MKKVLCLLMLVFITLFVAQCGDDDDGRRFISFNWGPDGVASERFTYMPSATYAGGGPFTLTITAADNAGSESPQITLSTGRAVDSNWEVSPFDFEVKLVTSAGFVTSNASGKEITVQDNGRKSGLFRATFGEIEVTRPAQGGGVVVNTLRNGVIQVDVINNIP
jgi:hypothetical protein